MTDTTAVDISEATVAQIIEALDPIYMEAAEDSPTEAATLDAMSVLEALRSTLTESQAAGTWNANMLTDANAELARLRSALTAREQRVQRYAILRQNVTPVDLARRLGVAWTDIPKDQSIEEKIDELCDAGLAAGKLLP